MNATNKTDLIDLMPEYIVRRFRTLKMQPGDWAELHKIFDRSQYAACVLAYQAKQRKAYRRCNTIFGLCPYWERGLCTTNKPCPMAEEK